MKQMIELTLKPLRSGEIPFWRRSRIYDLNAR